VRELKFRAWDKTYKVMTNDFNITSEGDFFNRNYPDGTPRTDEADIMQYTGLKDKNGKEIYEGDLVTYGDLPGVVEFSEHLDPKIFGWMTRSTHTTVGIKYKDGTTKEWITDKIGGIGPLGRNCYNELPEIVGNIYENPELMRGN